MPMVVTAMVVLVLLSLCAAPVLAAQYGSSEAQPATVAAIDSYLKLDSELGGTIKMDLGKIGDKWTVSSLKCEDIKVVAASGATIVATDIAKPGGAPATCVFSLKVPSGQPLSIYAVLGTGTSVGIKGFNKLGDGSYSKVAVTTDLKSENFLKIDGFKSGVSSIKFDKAGQQTLPLYLKLDQQP